MAARLFWVLDYLGQSGGRLLDGGWPAWASGGHAISRAIASVPASDFRANPQPDKIAGLDWMRSHLSDRDVIVVDARSPEEYAGAVAHANRGGHIPGAVSMNWTPSSTQTST